MNKKEQSIIFRQSSFDFPMNVSLGRDMPSFGLHRFRKGLRFIPSDDEDFSLKGNKQQLLYKGRKRSHRISILGDKAFEYDCILNKEPDNNVISLRMEGAENYNFYKQPNFVEEPFLRGSYAVYKKDIFVGEGTGKLCHIHRPELIDARGRRCWGNLSIEGNELLITIPEQWLADAKYPVIVDPIIGTTTLGSIRSSWRTFEIYCKTGVNKYIVPGKGGGLCRAYLYVYEWNQGADVFPCIYTNKPIRNTPYLKKSNSENEINVFIGRNDPPCWRNNTFSIDGYIEPWSTIWFGVGACYFNTLFDYGGECFIFESHGEPYDENTNLPYYTEIDDEEGDIYCNITWTWYFTYDAIQQNFVSTITQGVRLSDTRKTKINFLRNLLQTLGVNSLLNRLPVFYRYVAENIKVKMDIFQSSFFSRKCIELLDVISGFTRIFNVIRKIQNVLNLSDNKNISILFLRSVPDTVQITHTFRHWGEFLRELMINAENIAETSFIADYKRFTSDTVHFSGTVFRGLLLFVRIVTKIVLRDYILGRFLIAKENFILKSPVCKDIKLNSRID